ncbi:MAG: 50S ribosomal protein L15 [Candidatus Omnitrophica bacterium CG11_big_fil_rev_8_21_14_0_20_42_13]|uniref:Large ribosomal subunit protein uL15 n=1 Tax=Candidatus Ghiorseimicrobium undicola TaxID=1974746 RepID=A0A2H0LXF8_9BACT|nr:MAG: 50S ribosomal protein L15 [Candidatus Omnitrophica bacterium CG11_big_fil_rev_8_21_14_0_20_42_13]
MNLNELKHPRGSKKRRKIIGRGESSGHGKTSTRGHKGQRARSGRGTILGFEGGQNPLIRRIPKRGFNARRKIEYQIVNLNNLRKFSSETPVTPEILKAKGLIKDADKLVKILGKGEITKPLMIKAHAFSKGARISIEKSGGKAECLKD